MKGVKEDRQVLYFNRGCLWEDGNFLSDSLGL